MSIYLNGTASGGTGGLIDIVTLSTSNHSWCGFVNYTRSTGNNQAIWQIYGGNGSSSYHGIIQSSGTWNYFFNNTLKLTGPAPVIGAWWFFGLVCNGSSTNMYYKTIGTTAPTKQNTASAGTFTITPGGVPTLLIGDDEFTPAGGRQNPLDGQVSYFKYWKGVALSDTEMQRESYQLTPARTSGLTAFWSLNTNTDIKNQTRDATYDLTASSPANVTTVNNPPINLQFNATAFCG
jgi:hypothetical protein